MGLTKEQWKDAIQDISEEVMSGVWSGSYKSISPAKGKLPEMLFAEMKHCIGLDDQRPYQRAGRYFFKPYRNYYGAGQGDALMWDALTELGFANCDEIYHLSLNGIVLLSYQTGIYIYNPGDNCLEDAKDLFILRGVFAGYGCWVPVTKKELKAACHFTERQVNDMMVYLVQGAWIAPMEDKGIADDGIPYYVKGWTASEKLKATEKYKNALKEEEKRVNEHLHCEAD